MEALSKLQLLVWSKPLPAYNTFIGGAGITYPTASSLSTAMSIPAEAIQRFTIDNQNNISCRIDRDYAVAGSAFASTTSYKNYYIDLDARMTTVTWISAMSEVKNLKLRLLGLTNWYSGFNSNGNPNLVFLPELTAGQGSVFTNWTEGVNRLYVPKLSSFSTLGGSSSQFSGYNSNSNANKKHLIYINSAISTNTGLLTAVTKGAIVRVVTNYDTPNKVTDLSVAEVKPRMVKLNFSTPTAGTNPIDFYEVWYEKVEVYRDERKYLPSNSEIKASNDYATFLEPETKYKMYVCTVDEMYNGSGMFKDAIKRANSNIIEFTTTALSGYQIGMSAYLKLATNSFDFNGINQTGDSSLTYSGGYAKFTNGYVDVADNESLSFTDGTNDISAHVAFGFIWNSKTGTQFFMSKRNLVAGGAEWDVVSFSGFVRFQFSNPTSLTDAIKIEIPLASITAGVLNTLQFSYNGSKSHTGLKAYLNGVSIGTSSMVGTYTGQVNGVSQLRIGREIFSSSNYLKADMKELAVWKNRTMSPTEITDIDYRIKNNISLI